MTRGRPRPPAPQAIESLTWSAPHRFAEIDVATWAQPRPCLRRHMTALSLYRRGCAMRGVQRLPEILEQILDILEADRQTHGAGSDPCDAPLRVVEIAAGQQLRRHHQR